VAIGETNPPESRTLEAATNITGASTTAAVLMAAGGVLGTSTSSSSSLASSQAAETHKTGADGDGAAGGVLGGSSALSTEHTGTGGTSAGREADDAASMPARGAEAAAVPGDFTALERRERFFS
jgi:hypothetical protein